jgi:hypothetical protein
MKLTVMRIIRDSSCNNGKTCPSLSKTDQGSLVVVGKIVTDSEALGALAIGENEIAAEVPAGLLEG